MIPRLTTTALAVLITTAAWAQDQTPGAHFLQNWDLDGDGAVTLPEAQEKRADVFAMFDQNENGQLDAPEYDLFDETRAADCANNAAGHDRGAMANADEGMARALNDTDGNGTVTKAEFETGSATWFARLDRSGDGRVTADDFGMGQGQGHGLHQGQGKQMGQKKTGG